MFTGIITHQAKITEVKKDKNTIFTQQTNPDLVNKLEIGASLAHDGTCLTILKKINDNEYQIQTMPETLKLTTFGEKKPGDEVNLEMPVMANQGLDGHMVQGHVDGLGVVSEYIQEKDNWVLTIKPEERLNKFIANKGSIAINGVSLTVSNKTKNTFSVSLIQKTLDRTNLSDLKAGHRVNLEIDVIARYMENYLRYKNIEIEN